METKLESFERCDIFTPDGISKLMADKLSNSGSLLEPSVGNGNLLKFINLENYNNIDVYELKEKYLSELTEKYNCKKIKKHNLDFLKNPPNRKYNNIIMNPPYIRIQDLTKEYREFIKNKNNIFKGNIDIYYVFIYNCIQLLEENGTLVCITPNSFLYNKSALGLRKYLFENTLIEEIIDYGSEKVFDKISVYCCITKITKNKKVSFIYNNSELLYQDIQQTPDYCLFSKICDNGNKKLKEICSIKNGIATLRDKIYIHDLKLFEEPSWKQITDSKKDKFIIYPYTKDGKIIPEEQFKNQNPLTYKYLLENKSELEKRDKGNKIYSTWYAYGRTQSLIYPERNCIYISTMINSSKIENFIYYKEIPILHYKCLRIEPNENVSAETIIDIIKKNSDLINKKSSKRSAGWINLSTTVLYDLS